MPSLRVSRNSNLNQATKQRRIFALRQQDLPQTNNFSSTQRYFTGMTGVDGEVVQDVPLIGKAFNNNINQIVNAVSTD